MLGKIAHGSPRAFRGQTNTPLSLPLSPPQLWSLFSLSRQSLWWYTPPTSKIDAPSPSACQETRPTGGVMFARRECPVSCSHTPTQRSVRSLVTEVPEARSRPLASAHSMRTDSITTVMGPTNTPILSSRLLQARTWQTPRLFLLQTSPPRIHALFHRLFLQVPPHEPLQTQRGHGTNRGARRKDNETSDCLTGSTPSLAQLNGIKDESTFHVA
jgi:hypothetical protein